VDKIGLEKMSDRLLTSGHVSAGTPAFEFLDWIEFLDKREQEVLRLRFTEEWEVSRDLPQRKRFRSAPSSGVFSM
jgi:hypothetical protein